MLVLARKLHQSILIGDTIRVTVLEVRDGQVRLGIDAPRGISVLREEILHVAAASNREACLGQVGRVDVAGDVAELVRYCLSGDREGAGGGGGRP
ncbi:MAG: carbon storage regulator CsrA [Bacillota bacterium]